MYKNRTVTVSYSMAHFLTDMGCAMLICRFAGIVTGTAGVLTPFLVVITYDFFAFVTELPAGAFLDHIYRHRGHKNRNGLIAASGCIVIAILELSAAGIKSLSPFLFLPAAVITGIANAMFHMGAGIDIINMSGRRASLSGFFISGGAAGLFLGTCSASLFDADPRPMLLSGFLLLVTALLIIWEYHHVTVFIDNTDRTDIRTGKACLIAALSLLFLVIAYRGFLGFSSRYSWRSGFMIGLAAALFTAAGKAAGGWAADRFGWRNTIAVSLFLCSVFAVFSDSSIFAGCMTLLLFNMTMPVCMMGLANLLPEWKGAAFGLNTAALFLGFVSYRLIRIPVSGLLSGVMTVISAFILLLILHIAPEAEKI